MKINLFHTNVEDKNTILDLNKSFNKLLKNGQFILGNNVEKFEKDLSHYLGAKYAVGVNSGTDAIQLSLLASGVKPGDIVITSSFTYFATIEAIHNIGAKPFIVDICRDTLQMDIDKINKKVLKLAKFIVPVHLFGGLVDMDKLMILKKDYKLKIIEDVAQSFGTKHKDKFVGTFGECGAFSFYPTKTMGAMGDAGAVVTNNSYIYKDLLKLRNHGHIDRDNFKFAGFNSRLDEIQAIFLEKRLKTIDSEINKRKSIGQKYFNDLNDIDNLKFFNNNIQTFNYFPMLTKSRKDRANLIKHLSKNNIQTSIYYKKPLSDLKFNWILKDDNFQNVEYVKNRIMCLPIYPDLDNSRLEYVIKKVRSFYS
jgi:dTDP-4-amino-4,6-dideoxygalactose transaminase